ncbi:MAG: tetratricopeptide repeat protein [Thermodesulfobacteriota bacterium]|nr:tetratricopeptide repeat protein [Thermodesulfobacteriota bacterium]
MSEIDQYYQLLGITPGVTEEELKHAYDNLIQLWHLDLLSPDPRLQQQAQNKLKEIARAYEEVSSYLSGKPKKFKETEEENQAETKLSQNETSPNLEEVKPKRKLEHLYPVSEELEQKNENKEIKFTAGSESYQLSGSTPDLKTFQKGGNKALFWVVGIVAFVIIIIWVLSKDQQNRAIREEKSAEFYNNRGVTFIKEGQDEKAIEDFSKAISIDPNNSQAYANRGYANYLKLDNTKAIEDLNKALNISPNFPRAYFLRALVHMSNTAYEKAIEDLNKAIASDPNFDIAYVRRGFIKFIKNWDDEALTDFNKAIGLNPKNVKAYLYRARVYIRKMDYESANSDFEQAISINPNDAEAYSSRGYMNYRRGQVYKAIDDYTKAIEINPKHSGAYDNRGYIYLDLGKYQSATKDFKKAVELDDKYVDAYIGLSIAFFRQKAFEQAKTHYQKTIDIEPLSREGADALERKKGYFYSESQKRSIKAILSLIKHQENQGKEAKFQKKDSLEERPQPLKKEGSAESYNKLGSSYVKSDQYDKAIEHCTAAISIDPSFTTAYLNRGYAYYKKTEYDKAINDFKKAISIEPQNAIAYGWCGNVYLAKKMYEEAIHYFSKAIEINPNNSVYYFNRGLVYDVKGETNNAILDFQKSCSKGEADGCKKLKTLGRIIDCPKCSRKLKVAVGIHGRVSCPFCNYEFEIPEN